MNKFLELEINRTEQGMILKARSKLISDLIKRMSKEAFGTTEPTMGRTSAGSLWGTFNYWKVANGVAGLTVNNGAALTHSGCNNAPWLCNTELEQGCTMNLNFPVSASGIKNYARVMKEVMERFYRDQYAPFKFEIIIHTEE